jgi:putative solute:sodium symporter small subunit
MEKEKLEQYHKENISLIVKVLIIWAIVSYFAAMIVKGLNNITFLGFPFGYWMGAQGSVITFVVLIFVYANLMNKLDKKYGVEE